MYPILEPGPSQHRGCVCRQNGLIASIRIRRFVSHFASFVYRAPRAAGEVSGSCSSPITTGKRPLWGTSSTGNVLDGTSSTERPSPATKLAISEPFWFSTFGHISGQESYIWWLEFVEEVCEGLVSWAGADTVTWFTSLSSLRQTLDTLIRLSTLYFRVSYLADDLMFDVHNEGVVGGEEVKLGRTG